MRKELAQQEPTCGRQAIVSVGMGGNAGACLEGPGGEEARHAWCGRGQALRLADPRYRCAAASGGIYRQPPLASPSTPKTKPASSWCSHTARQAAYWPISAEGLLAQLRRRPCTAAAAARRGARAAAAPLPQLAWRRWRPRQAAAAPSGTRQGPGESSRGRGCERGGLNARGCDWCVSWNAGAVGLLSDFEA